MESSTLEFSENQNMELAGLKIDEFKFLAIQFPPFQLLKTSSGSFGPAEFNRVNVSNDKDGCLQLQVGPITDEDMVLLAHMTNYMFGFNIGNTPMQLNHFGGDKGLLRFILFSQESGQSWFQ